MEKNTIRQQTVAITGISGYFGRILLPLLEADEEVGTILGFDLQPPENLPAGSKLVFHQIDIRDPHFFPLLKGSDTLVHLAFQVMRLPNANNVDEINIKAMRATCEAAASQGIRKLVVTSSVVAYGLHADNPVPLTEEAPLRPNFDLYYGMAKAGNESFLDDFTLKHPEMIVTRLRPCTVVGPNADPRMMASLTTNPTILIRGYNPPVQIVHEDDVAAALALAVKQDLPGVYNAVSDGACTLTEIVSFRGGKSLSLPYFLVKFLMSFMWRQGRSLFAPEWIDLSRYSLVASNTKLRTAGWKPRYTTAEAARHLFQMLDLENKK